MSIWCSHEHIGTDPIDWIDPMTGRPIPKVAQGGTVLSYAEGWSNHYPDARGTAERPAIIELANLPPWCVPGHREAADDWDDERIGPWLRLGVTAPETVNHWVKDEAGNPTVENRHATVVMDEKAARALAEQLTEWLNRPKARPRKGTP